MHGLLPAHFAAQDIRPANALVADLAAQGASETVLTLSLRRNRRETPLGEFFADEAGTARMRRRLADIRRRTAWPVLLRVPAQALLERTLTLPLAAERDLAGVLRYEMDRLTPFGAAEVFWSWAVERRERAHNRVLVRLSLVPKAGLLGPIAALRAAGALPVALEAPPRLIALRDDTERMPRQRTLVAASALCGVMALGAVLVPFVRQSLALRSVEHTIAALRPSVDQSERLRRRFAAEASNGDVFGRERSKLGNPLETLAVLTAIVPDDTYLTSLSLAQRKLELSGQSASAARLIVALAADPYIRNPLFAAPVTRDGPAGADLFSIRAELSP